MKCTDPKWKTMNKNNSKSSKWKLPRCTYDNDTWHFWWWSMENNGYTITFAIINGASSITYFLGCAWRRLQLTMMMMTLTLTAVIMMIFSLIPPFLPVHIQNWCAQTPLLIPTIATLSSSLPTTWNDNGDICLCGCDIGYGDNHFLYFGFPCVLKNGW